MGALPVCCQRRYGLRFHMGGQTYTTPGARAAFRELAAGGSGLVAGGWAGGRWLWTGGGRLVPPGPWPVVLEPPAGGSGSSPWRWQSLAGGQWLWLAHCSGHAKPRLQKKSVPRARRMHFFLACREQAGPLRLWLIGKCAPVYAKRPLRSKTRFSCTRNHYFRISCSGLHGRPSFFTLHFLCAGIGNLSSCVQNTAPHRSDLTL